MTTLTGNGCFASRKLAAACNEFVLFCFVLFLFIDGFVVTAALHSLT